MAHQVKTPPAMQETLEMQVQYWAGKILWRREEKANHSSILAGKIPWTEKPGRLPSMGMQESDATERLSTQV